MLRADYRPTNHLFKPDAQRSKRPRSLRLFIAFTVAFFALVNCTDSSPDPESSQAGASGSAGSSTIEPGSTGLPCAVEAIVINRCSSCHGDPPSQGAPKTLTNYDALKDDSEKTKRWINDANNPMPRGGQLPADELQVMNDWLDNGTPKRSTSDVCE